MVNIIIPLTIGSLIFALEANSMAGAAKSLLRRDLECDLCKRVIGVADGEIKDKRNEEAIVAALENVCKSIPGKEQPKCDTFIEQYSNELIHILIEEEDPGMACRLLGVC
ncbi:hypothetical protein AFLA70_76g002610 [Aspergillus flavus AF70]|nr:hypothetical protein AFLA70_76g002610 [Aspergillus flavus AF70]